jgi:ligand-binding SRPBCC domain-containing protein
MEDFSLERTQVVPRTLAETFSFFADPSNLEAITPGWLRFRILEAPERIQRGSRLRYRLSLFGVPIGWRAEITEWLPPRTFTDTQVAGPYSLWVHAHRFAHVAGGTEIHDHVRYRIPGAALAVLPQRLFVRAWLDEIFDFRAAELATRLG